MRKTRAQQKVEEKLEQTKSTSSEDDHKNTEDIIDKLSKKYKKTAKKSTESEKQPLKSRKSARIKTKEKNGYDADVDSAVETARVTSSSETDSPVSSDCYSFEGEEEKMSLCLPVSPNPKSSKTKKPVKPQKGTSQKKGLSDRGKNAVNQLNSENDMPSISAIKKEKCRKRSGHFDTPSVSPVVKSRKSAFGKLTDKKLNNLTTASMDSGVFTSPYMEGFSKVNVKNTSTPNTMPSNMEATHKKTKESKSDDSCFGFNSDDSPMMSPVHKYQDMSSVGSSKSGLSNFEPTDMGSPKLKSFEKTSLDSLKSPTSYSAGKKQMPVVNSRMYDVEPKEVKKRPVKKQKKSVPKVDEWASQMNVEFDDIEMYELSIEG